MEENPTIQIPVEAEEEAPTPKPRYIRMRRVVGYTVVATFCLAVIMVLYAAMYTPDKLTEVPPELALLVGALISQSQSVIQFLFSEGDG